MLRLFGIDAKQNSPTLYISIGNLRLPIQGLKWKACIKMALSPVIKHVGTYHHQQNILKQARQREESEIEKLTFS